MKFPQPTPHGLKQNYLLYFETALILSLATFIGLTKINLPATTADNSTWTIPEQEILHLEGIVTTNHIIKPPSPPVIPVPNPPPKNEIIQEQLRNLDIEFPQYEPIPLPIEQNAFREMPEEPAIPLEDRPELIGGMAKLKQDISYPRKAIRDKVEGRVILEFIVDEKGYVRGPKVLKGVRDDINQEAIKAISNARFVPARKKGKSIPVKHYIFIRFEIHKKSK